MMNMASQTWKKKLLAALLVLVCNSAIAEPEVVLVVSKKANVTMLTAQQVADIFLGKTATYPDGTRVIPIDQEDGSEVREAFYHQYIGRTREQVRAYWSKIVFTGKGAPPLEIVSSERLIRIVRDNPNYIGYIRRDAANGSVKIIDVQQR